MTDKNPSNKVDRSPDGTFHASWHGQEVYQNGRVKHFKTEEEALEYLIRCDVEGKIIH
jgi:hypothetical protein